MKPSRRRLLAALLCALPFATLGDEQAQAFLLHRGGVASGGVTPGLLTTMTLANATGANDTPMWSKIFGHPFVDLDLPLSGGLPTYPIFKIGATVVPYSCSIKPTLHPSGCIRHMSFVLLLGGNFTIPANGTLTVSIYSGGAAPAASSRNQSDFTPADLKQLATILDNDTTGLGTYTASLNAGITAAMAGNYAWMDGAAGKMWFIQADYFNGATPEGNLTSGWYVMSMQDASGNFGGILCQSFASLPWQDSTPSTKLWKSFTTFQFKSGGSVVRDMTTQRTNTQTIAWSGSGPNFNTVGNIIETGQLIRLTSSSGPGNLPAGFSDNTSYFVFTGDRYTSFANKMLVGTSSAGIITEQSAITPTTAGTGTITATAYLYMTYYAKQFFCGTNAEYDFVQGGGSVSSVTVSRSQMNNVYWMATLTIPKYDLTIGTPTSSASSSYYVNSSGPWSHSTNATSEREELGVLPSPYARHIYTQAAIDELAVRVGSIVQCNMPVNVRTKSNGCLIPYNNGPGGSGTYPGMVTPQPLARWGGASTLSTTAYLPNSSTVLRATFDSFAGDHRTGFAYYAYVLTGQPEYLDMLLEIANASIGFQLAPGTTTTVINTSTYAPLGVGANASSRIVTTGSITRWGIVMQTTTQRDSAWNIRDMGCASEISPNPHPQCAGMVPYLKDVVADNAAFMVDIINLAPTTYAATTKLFYVTTGIYFNDVWMQSYMIQAVSLFLGMSGSANWKTFVNGLNTFWSHYANTFGAFATGAEEILIRAGGGNSDPIATSDAGIGFVAPQVTWNGTADFTMVIPTAGGGVAFTPFVGDIINFSTPDPPSVAPSTPLPAAFNAFTPYYVSSVTFVSGITWTIQLTLTPGGIGPAIPNTDSSTHLTTIWYQLQKANQPANDSRSGTSNTGYLTNLYRSVLLSTNRGCSFDSAALAAIGSSNRQPANSSFLPDPKFCFAA